MSQTNTISRLVARQDINEIPDEVIECAKRMILDTIAVSLAGASTDSTKLALEVTLEESAIHGNSSKKKGVARVLASEESLSSKNAAFINGIMAHSLDYDDIHEGFSDNHQGMMGHPSAPVLPAALAVAESSGESGRNLLKAFILGTEVECVLGDIMNPGTYERGWHPTSVFGHFGATTAAGSLLKLSVGEFRNAYGITGSQTGGIKGNFGTMTKPYHTGRAARAGIEAAKLAKSGFTGNENILELDFGGFCELFKGDKPYNFRDHLNNFGNPWKIQNPGVWFKPYPCCGSTHTSIEAAFILRKEYGIDHSAIEHIDIFEHPRVIPHTNRPEPRTPLECKFSVQYCVDVVLRKGEISLADFTYDAIKDYKGWDFLKTISVHPDYDIPEEESFRSTLDVATRTGEKLEVTVGWPKGSNERPLNDSELRDKFRRCSENILPADRVDSSLEKIEDLENLKDVQHLVDDLVNPGSSLINN